MRTAISLILATILSTFLYGQDIQQFENDPFRLKKYVLKNGLTVLLSENRLSPEVYGMVVVKAGGKNDPADATGLAHYLEHMLFKGTEQSGTINYALEKPYLDAINNLYEELGTLKADTARKRVQKEINKQSILAGEFAIPNELDRMLANIGSTQVNAFTTEDYTTYYNKFPSHQMDKWLEIYAHRFENPVFRLFQSELETVYEEKNKGNDQIFNKVMEKYNASFYKNHPYGQQSIIGTTEHLKNPPLKKMYAYFNDYYVANNMALILAGDFDSNEIIPLIEAKFGNWRSAAVPLFESKEETKFYGKEIEKVHLTPIKVGILGFRTVPKNHEDEVYLEIVNNLLSNDEQAGLIDELNMNGDVLMAGLYSSIYNDHGGTMIFVVPKLVGQSLDQAEKLIKDKIDQLKRGDFSDDFLNAVKLNTLKKYSRKIESNQDRVLELAEVFSSGLDWTEYLNLELRIKNATKAQVIKAANAYYGEDYLLFVSRIGFPKKEKLEKPGFDPILPKKEAKSSFYSRVEQIGSAVPAPKFIDFSKDVSSSYLKEHVKLNSVYNPHNNVFNLDIKYQIGSLEAPILNHLASYLELIGSETFSPAEIRRKIYELGCSYSFNVTDSEFVIKLEGPDPSFSAALVILNQFLSNPKADKKKVKKLLQDEKASRRLDRRNPAFVANAMQEYVLYGKQSKFLKELSKQNMRNLSGESLLSAYKDLLKRKMVINYSGNKSNSELRELLESYWNIPNSVSFDSVPERDRIAFQTNKIYLLHKKNFVQSQICYNIEGKVLDLEQNYLQDAFNEYFGTGMSSIVFQEIREFRSLAYTAQAKFFTARTKGKNNFFKAYVGCQSDKTNESMQVMMKLLKEMPEKPERIEILKNSMIQSAMLQRPNFRMMADQIENWKKMGYDEDPMKSKFSKYENLSFTDIYNFYKENIQGQPVVITIVGDMRKLDKKELAKLGEIIEIKEKEIFNF